MMEGIVASLIGTAIFAMAVAVWRRYKKMPRALLDSSATAHLSIGVQFLIFSVFAMAVAVWRRYKKMPRALLDSSATAHLSIGVQFLIFSVPCILLKFFYSDLGPKIFDGWAPVSGVFTIFVFLLPFALCPKRPFSRFIAVWTEMTLFVAALFSFFDFYQVDIVWIWLVVAFHSLSSIPAAYLARSMMHDVFNIVIDDNPLFLACISTGMTVSVYTIFFAFDRYYDVDFGWWVF